jgi:hypothetical protein
MHARIWYATLDCTSSPARALTSARRLIQDSVRLELISESETVLDYRAMSDHDVPSGPFLSGRIEILPHDGRETVRWTLRIDVVFLIFMLCWLLLLAALPMLIIRAAFLPTHTRPAAIGVGYVITGLVYAGLLLPFGLSAGAPELSFAHCGGFLTCLAERGVASRCRQQAVRRVIPKSWQLR